MQNELRANTPRHISLVGAIIFAILAVSTASIFIRYAQTNVPSIVIAAWRLSLATIILAPLALGKRGGEIRQISRRDWVLMILSGIFLALHFASWITSLEFTTVASSVVLVTTAPLWVALLSPLVLKESVNKNVGIGLIFAMVGGVIVGISEACQLSGHGISCTNIQGLWQGRALIGNLLALLGAVFSASYLIIGRKARAGLSLPVYTFIVYGVAAICLLMGVFVSGNSLLGYPTVNYLWFLGLAILPQLMGHSTFNWALKYLPASYVSVALLGEPVGSVILALFLLQEIPTVLEVSGATLILIGILIASLNKIVKISPIG